MYFKRIFLEPIEPWSVLYFALDMSGISVSHYLFSSWMWLQCLRTLTWPRPAQMLRCWKVEIRTYCAMQQEDHRLLWSGHDLEAHYSLSGRKNIRWNAYQSYTVKPDLWDHYHKRPTVLMDHRSHMYLNATEPITKDHLLWETIFLWQMKHVF